MKKQNQIPIINMTFIEKEGHHRENILLFVDTTSILLLQTDCESYFCQCCCSCPSILFNSLARYTTLTLTHSLHLLL